MTHKQRNSLINRVYKARYIYLALLPCVGMICLFLVYPALNAIRMSFTNWKMTSYYSPKFVGIDNYITVLKDGIFWKSMLNLLIFIGWGFLSTMLWMVPITYLVYRLGAGRLGRFFQRAYVIPMMVPGMVVTLFWRFFYEPNFGMLNNVLKMLGAPKSLYTFVWLGEKSSAIPALLFMGFPWISGFGFLIVLAGFQGVDASLHESAMIDGAKATSIFARIDMPLILPQLKLLIILGMIGGIQQYTNQMIMTNGGPNYATYVPGLLMYNTAFTYQKLGQGSALGVILFILIMAFTVFANTKIKRVD